MSRYLLEIGTEEIPARFMAGFLEDLKKLTEQTLTQARVSYGQVRTLGTYRRLALTITDLADHQADVNDKVKGPPAAISVDKNGEFLPPAMGFAKRLGIPPSQLVTEEENGQAYLFGIRKEKGRPVKDLLPELMQRILDSLQLPIAMRWGHFDRPFYRPVHWMVSLLDKEIVPFSFFDIKAGNISYGHRFLTSNPNDATIASGQEVVISSASDYEALLEQAFVIADQKKRETIIRKGLAHHHVNQPDAALVEETVFLTEFPTLLTGQFDKAYLDIPAEVLVQCMKKHQKYFPIYETSTLTHRFVVVADSVTDQSRANITKGNEQVLRARLEDVKFFWDEDRKKRLEDRLPKLHQVVFQKNLGSMADKVARIRELSLYLLNELKMNAHKTDVLRTAELCKADLVTQMVFELPDLQGVMGRIYALKQNEKTEVAQGIEDHYRPRSQGDALPATVSGKIVGIADRLDTIVSCYANRLLPTGSQDPWGVRRAMLAILTLVVENAFRLDLLACFKKAYDVLGRSLNRPDISGNYPNLDALISFFEQRVKGYLQENKTAPVSADIADAVTFTAISDPFLTVRRAQELETLRRQNPDGFKVVTDTAVRVGRLAEKAGTDAVSLSLFKEEIEQKSWQAYTTLEAIPDADISAFLPLCQTMTAYFDKVLVMHEDSAVRDNRLGFLKQLNRLFKTVADFERIAV